MLVFTSHMILKCFEVPSTNRDCPPVYILGAGGATRITVLSQQVRAIYLVKCLHAQGRLADKKIGIIGGGVAGTTAAYAALHDGARSVTIFERNSDVLMRFKEASHRRIHPHLYDWPRPKWDRPDAGLPFMNWEFGLASEITKTLKGQFEDLRKQYKDRIKVIQYANDVHITDPQVPNQMFSISALIGPSHPMASIVDQFDHVFIAIGPGKERLLTPTSSYWTPDILKEKSSQQFVVVGTGDGGLIDSLRVRLTNFDEQMIYAGFWAEWEPNERRTIERRILKFEGEAREINKSSEEINNFYHKQADEAKSACAWLSRNLRTDTSLILVGREPNPLTGYSCPINRFLYTCLRNVDFAALHSYQQGKDKYDAKKTWRKWNREKIFELRSNTLPVTSNMTLILRTGAESELPTLSRSDRLHQKKPFTIPSADNQIERLDIFQSYDPQIDIQLQPGRIRDVVPSSSKWSHQQYPAHHINSTRYIRCDPVTGKLVGEHEKRGRGEDSKTKYLERISFTVVDAISTHRRVLLIGDYGTGKSHIVDRIMLDATTAFTLKCPLTDSQRFTYPQWKHSKAWPMPVRVSLLDFAAWASTQPSQQYPLFEYIRLVADRAIQPHQQSSEKRTSAAAHGDTDDWVKATCKTSGLLLFLEDWTDLSASRDERGALHCCTVTDHVSAFLEFVTFNCIDAVVVITAVNEPAQRFPEVRSLLATFERFVIAKLDPIPRRGAPETIRSQNSPGVDSQRATVKQETLITRFCESRGGLPQGEFVAAFEAETLNTTEAIARTPAGLKQILEGWVEAESFSLAATRLRDIYLRFIGEYFQVDMLYAEDPPRPRVATVVRLRLLLARKYCASPTSSRIVFHREEIERANSTIDDLVAVQCLIQHADNSLSVRSVHIQNLIVAWGLSEGDHVRKTSAALDSVSGVSFLDRILIVADSLAASEKEAECRFCDLHIEPLLQAMTLELDRVFYGSSLLEEAGRTIESLLDYLLLRSEGAALRWVAALFISETPIIIKQMFRFQRREKIAGWAASLVGAIGEAHYEHLAPHHRRHVGRALSLLSARRKGVSVGEDALPDIHWIPIPTGVECCGQTQADIKLYSEGECYTPPDDEDFKPVRCDRAFEMSKYPVTNAQFRLFVEDTISGFYSTRFWDLPLSERQCPADLFSPESQNCPVTSVRWDAACAFAQWFSAFSGDVIELPGSDEWEYAARVGHQQGAVFSGKDNSKPYAAGNCQDEGLPGVVAVGLFPEADTPLGLSDMSGNVFEWCSDFYSSDAPNEKVTKGGSWNHDKLRCRLALRGKKRHTETHPYIGFRLVRRRKLERPQAVAVVGSGFSGICTTVRLLALADLPMQVVVIERSEDLAMGGLAYQRGRKGEENWEHLFNLQALRVSMFREDREDFLRWLNDERDKLTLGPERVKARYYDESSDVPRCLYHHYLRSRLGKAVEAANSGVCARLVVGNVESVNDSKTKSVLLLMRDAFVVEVLCSQAIICTGNLQTKSEPFIDAHVQAARNYIADQYTAEAQERIAAIIPGARVLLIGKQLRAFDAIMTLRYEHSSKFRDNITITMVSRSSELHRTYPKDHCHAVQVLRRPPFLDRDELTADEVPGLVRAEYLFQWDELAQIPKEFRGERILKAWEQHVPELIKKMNPEDVIALVRKYGSLITTLRIGVVPEIGLLVEAEIEKNKTVIPKSAEVARITTMGTDGPFYVEFFRATGDDSADCAPEIRGSGKSPRGIVESSTYDVIINCMGREKDYSKVKAPLWRDLFKQHLTRRHWTGIGIDVDWQGMLIDEEERSSRWLAAVGVMREGVEFARYGRLGSFSFTLGPIKNQALDGAVHCLRRLRGQIVSPDTLAEVQRVVSEYPAAERTGDARDFCLRVVRVALEESLLSAGVDKSASKLGVDVICRDPGFAISAVKHQIAKLCSRRYEDSRKAQDEFRNAFQSVTPVFSSVLKPTQAETFESVFSACLEEAALVHLIRLDVVQPKRVSGTSWA